MNQAYRPEKYWPPVTDRPPKVVCFGEVLWDCLPSGRKPGGAPCNVAYHLQRLGCQAQLASAVGTDPLGEEMLAYLRSKGLSTELIQRHPHLPTGTVEVSLAADGQPQYDIRTGVAWDEIALNEEVLRAVRECDAIVFGTLAARSETNRKTLDALLAIPEPRKFIDVNLRPPFDDRERALALACKADWIKLNKAELGALTLYPLTDDELADTLDRLRELTDNVRACLTRGDQPSILWQQMAIVSLRPPKVKVVDTVGAGDAFTAALLHGIITKRVEYAPEVLAHANKLGALVASLPGAQPDYKIPW